MQGHPGPHDARRPRTAIGLEDVTVQCDLLLSQGGEVRNGPQATADEPLDLLGAPRLAAPGGLPVDPFRAMTRAASSTPR